jgi:hypothetical protein
MNDTPRTDALNHRTYSCGKGYRLAVHADLCRELERELAAVTAERDELKELNYRYTSALWERGDELAAVTTERDELLQALEALDLSVSKVYDYVTGGKCTKPNTHPDVVKALADDWANLVAEDNTLPSSFEPLPPALHGTPFMPPSTAQEDGQ